MAAVRLIGASENTAARLLDMKPADFRAIVAQGYLPRGREIAPGVVRWDVDELTRIAKGDAADGMGDVKW